MSASSRAVLLRRLLLSASLGAVACGGATTDSTDSTDGASAGAAGTGGASGASQGDGGAGESAGGSGGAGVAGAGATAGIAGSASAGGAGAGTGGVGPGGLGGSAGGGAAGAGGTGTGGTGTGGAGSAGKSGGPGAGGSGTCSHSLKCLTLAQAAKNMMTPPAEPLTACPAAGEMSSGLCYWYAALTSTENDTCCYDYVSGTCCGRPLLTDGGPRVARLAHRADWA